jgi:hypothetical protein
VQNAHAMKAFFYVVGIFAILLVLANTGALQGQVCVGDLGCVVSEGNGIGISNDGPPATVQTP